MRSVSGNRSRYVRPSIAYRKTAFRPVRRDYFRRYVPHVHIYTRPVLRIRWPKIHVHISWPWTIRARRYWAPKYRYRQVVYVRANTGYKERTSRVELETHYRHRVISANNQMAELEITIESVDVFHEGRYLGSVEYVPQNLGTIYATVYNNGDVRFDREVFLLGDPYAGFEMISTRYYDGYVFDKYQSSDGYRAGRLDLRSGEVYEIGKSRLFNPYTSTSHIPVSLLPENEGWLWDYGAEAMSAALDNYDYYYGAGSSGLQTGALYESDPYQSADEYQFTTGNGTNVYVRKDTEIQRIE